jgi:hypothetical protein
MAVPPPPAAALDGYRPPSGLEVCRCFEFLAAIRCCSSNGNNRCSLGNTAFVEGTWVNARQAVVHDRNCHVCRTKHEPLGAPLEALISPLHHHGCHVVLRNLVSRLQNQDYKTQEGLRPPEEGLPARPRTSGSRLALHHVCANTAGLQASLGCNGARWPTRSSTAVTPGLVRGHRAPATTINRRLPHRDPPPQIHSHVQTAQSPTCYPGRSSPAPSSEAPTTNYTGPVATPAPCSMICHLQPAWIK